MVRRNIYQEIKNDPERYEIYKESRRRYRENRKKDPIRYAHYKKMHRLERKRSYEKYKQKISLKSKQKYNLLSESEKLIIYEKAKNNRIKRRKIILEKWGNKCQKCGYSEHPEILEFDHIIPLHRKTNGIKKVVSDHMLPEVIKYPEKFELLCANCHRLKTIRETRELWEKRRKIKLDNLQSKVL